MFTVCSGRHAALLKFSCFAAVTWFWHLLRFLLFMGLVLKFVAVIQPLLHCLTDVVEVCSGHPTAVALFDGRCDRIVASGRPTAFYLAHGHLIEKRRQVQPGNHLVSGSSSER